VLLLLPLLVIIGVLVEADRDDDAPDETRPEALTATAGEQGSLSSTWYCPVGTATGVTSGEGAGVAEQQVVVANASDADVSGTLTIYPTEGEPVRVPLTIGAQARSQIDVTDHVTAPWAAALVETAGGEVSVAQELTGPTGRSVADCTSTPSADWWFPAGSSNRTQLFLALFNPFPGEATVDVTFETEDGVRTPQDYDGIVVPGGSVVVKEVSQTVQVANHVSTHVRSRSGRVVAEQLMVMDGTDDTPTGLTATVGAPAPAEVWAFPASPPTAEGAIETVSVFNPGEDEAEVLVQVQVDDPDVNGSVEPFTLFVPAGRYQEITISDDERVPPDAGRWVIVRGLEGAGVVAQRTLAGGATDGIASTIGLPVSATRWLAPVAVAGDSEQSSLWIANPSPVRTATVTVRRRGGGTVEDVPDAIELTIAPGERLSVDLVAAGLPADGSVEVVSDVGVVVGLWMTFSDLSGTAQPMAVPVAGTQEVITDVVDPGLAGGLDTEDLAPSETLVDPDQPAETGTSSTTTPGG
jgi:hypothetical protein